MTWSDLATVVASGVLLGALYGLMSYGLGLIYGVMKIVNLAHGAMLTVGAYGTLWLHTNYRIDPLLSIPLIAAGAFAIGALIEIGLVKKIREAPAIASLLLLFGVWLVVKNILYLVFGGDGRLESGSRSGAAGLHLGEELGRTLARGLGLGLRDVSAEQ